MNRCAREDTIVACASRSAGAARTAAWSALLVLLLGSPSQAGLPGGHGKSSDIAIRFAPGVYYPQRPYYSRAYLQPFELQRGQNPLIIRLAPFDNYARFRLGNPVTGLTEGTVDSDVFPYRYGSGFRAAPVRAEQTRSMGPPRNRPSPPNRPLAPRGKAARP